MTAAVPSAADGPIQVSRTRLPGLDGLRAVAVVAVLLYHADYSWASGGYLGVDLFFVLSGFLVTGLLLSEHDRTQQVSFARFWTRRIRRLFPAQVTLLLTALLFIFVFHRPELYEFRGQGVAALTAMTNWFLIHTQSSYFDAIGRPPVLRHLWSLAIEMQFYVVWPVVFLGLVRTWRRSLATLVAVTVGGALASSLLMAVIVNPANPSGAYYNSFSRLTGLLLGAALAMVWRPRRLERAPIAAQGAPLDRAGLVALGLVGVCFFWATDTGLIMYRVGFLVFSLLSVVLVAVASHPSARLAGERGLGHPVLVAIGARSYGIYLWHWPVYAFTRPGADVHWGQTPTFVVRLILTGLLSEACYRFVEQPWHRQQVGLADMRRLFRRPEPGAWIRPVGVGAATLVLGTALVFTLIAPVHKDATVAAIEQGQGAIDARKDTPPPTPAGPVVTATTVAVPPTQPNGQRIIPDFSVDGQPPYVTAIGDSVMVGSAQGLYDRFGDRIYIDAHVGRQAKGVPAIVAGLRQSRGLGNVLLVHIGTNGTFTEDQIRAVVDAAQGTPVVFVTARADRSWIPDVNATLARVVPTLPNAYLVDWYTIAQPHGDWFRPDTVHLTKVGVDQYTTLLFDALTGKAPTT